jgi:hypothetical protein
MFALYAATAAGSSNRASLFFGEFTRLLTGCATMLSAGYGFSALRASDAEPVSQASTSFGDRMAGMRCLAL